jgi:hypothetical protein
MDASPDLAVSATAADDADGPKTTSIDQQAGLISLTTVLAHSSGEWVSSDWPVFPVAETAAPHRMGAAGWPRPLLGTGGILLATPTQALTPLRS